MNDVQLSKDVIPPVAKSIKVERSLEEAFRLFTEGIHTWWPLGTYSVGQDKANTCVLEGKVGGRFYEVQEDGSQADWGEILLWEPPRRFITTWHPGRGNETAQEVEVIFTAEGTGTRVELTHRDWALLGDRAEEMRESYEQGWDNVLGLYASLVETLERL